MPEHFHKRLLGIGLFYTLLGTPAMAAVQTIIYGKDLMNSCQQALHILEQRPNSVASADQNDAFVCMAYLGGIISTAQHANELAKLRYALTTEGRGAQPKFRLYCFDWQRPYKTFAKIVVNFGRSQPIYLQQPAHKLVMRALQAAFPCR
jgi:Rap1a immunity proteins